LFLGDGGYLTCAILSCPDPGSAGRLLDLAAPSREPAGLGGARHRRVAAAITVEHYRRSNEQIVAPPEDHSAAMAAVALRVLADDLRPDTPRTRPALSAGHADTAPADTTDTAETGATRKDAVRTAIARAFDVPAELAYGHEDAGRADIADAVTGRVSDTSAVRDPLIHWPTATTCP